MEIIFPDLFLYSMASGFSALMGTPRSEAQMGPKFPSLLCFRPSWTWDRSTSLPSLVFCANEPFREKFIIRLHRPFRIAHGSSDTRDTIIVTLKDAGFVARGEGALPPYYPSKAATCLSWIEDVAARYSFDSEATLEEQISQIPAAPPEAVAARVALEIALHDLGLSAGISLWKIWGLQVETAPCCARTLSIPANEAELRDLLGEGGQCFKLKAGSGDVQWDEAFVKLARAFALTPS